MFADSGKQQFLMNITHILSQNDKNEWFNLEQSNINFKPLMPIQYKEKLQVDSFLLMKCGYYVQTAKFVSKAWKMRPNVLF